MTKRRRAQRRAAIIAIAIVILIAVFALIYQERTYRAQYVSVPEIRTGMVSSTDGTTHNVRARFEVQVDESIRSSISTDELHDRLSVLISNMEYDTLVGENGLAYVKEEMTNDLNEYIDPEMLIGVYVWDIITDEDFSLSEPVRTRDSFRNRVFDAIFGQ